MERGIVIGLIIIRKVLLGGGGYLVKRKSFFFLIWGVWDFLVFDNFFKYVEYFEKKRGGFKWEKSGLKI